MLPYKRPYLFFIAVCALLYFYRPVSLSVSARGWSNVCAQTGRHTASDALSLSSNDQVFHILTVATDPDTNLCKALFSGAVLEYPPPNIIAWKQDYDKEKGKTLQGGGGSHLLKVSKVLEWLENLPSERDNDLVMMMDGYDIWFQLPKNVLIERYHRISMEANRRIKKRMGRAANIENIKQKILFVAGKRCFPNEIHTVACWPLPPSPLYKDMWEGNTDHTIGSFPNIWAATRQKFLNSGVIIGPAKDMRALFARAAQKIRDLGDEPEEDDNGSGWSEQVYKHSDQSVFNMIFGEQEYQREVMRIRHMSWLWNPIYKTQELFGKDLSDTSETLEGNPIENILNPPWSHAEIPHLPGKPLEFGIGLDYWSQLAFETANSERNAGWLKYSEPLDPQIENKGRWDCKPHPESVLPADILSQDLPFHVLGVKSTDGAEMHKRDDDNQPQPEQSPDQESGSQSADMSDQEAPSNDQQQLVNNGDSSSQPAQEQETQEDNNSLLSAQPWTSIPLYTNICAGTIPVLVHLNGDKGMRERNWTNMWFQPEADRLAQALRPREALSPLKGASETRMLQPWEAFSDTGEVVDFSKEGCGEWDFQ